MPSFFNCNPIVFLNTGDNLSCTALTMVVVDIDIHKYINPFVDIRHRPYHGYTFQLKYILWWHLRTLVHVCAFDKKLLWFNHLGTFYPLFSYIFNLESKIKQLCFIMNIQWIHVHVYRIGIYGYGHGPRPMPWISTNEESVDINIMCNFISSATLELTHRRICLQRPIL